MATLTYLSPHHVLPQPHLLTLGIHPRVRLPAPTQRPPRMAQGGGHKQEWLRVPPGQRVTSGTDSPMGTALGLCSPSEKTLELIDRA